MQSFTNLAKGAQPSSVTSRDVAIMVSAPSWLSIVLRSHLHLQGQRAPSRDNSSERNGLQRLNTAMHMV
jgi:hypothetical protein